MIERNLLLELVSAGITASSPDNSQPFKFKLLDDGIELHLDPARLGMFFDVNGYASLLGCGGVIEIIRLTAGKYGLKTDVTRHEVNAPEYKVATLDFSVCQTTESEPLADAIHSRCTYRGYFNSAPVSDMNIKIIESVLDDAPNAFIHWFSGDSRKEVTRILTSTDRLRYTHKELHHDFYSKLRFGADIEKKRDGLAANTLGLESVLALSLPLLKSWLVAKGLSLLGIHYFMAWRGATVPLNDAAEIGMLVLPRNMDPIDQGILLHRVWMAINAIRGLQCQIFGAFPLFIRRINDANGEGFSAEQKRFLQKNISDLEQLTGIETTKQHPVIFFRIGYPRQSLVRSLRRPVESFLIK